MMCAYVSDVFGMLDNKRTITGYFLLHNRIVSIEVYIEEIKHARVKDSNTKCFLVFLIVFKATPPSPLKLVYDSLLSPSIFCVKVKVQIQYNPSIKATLRTRIFRSSSRVE